MSSRSPASPSAVKKTIKALRDYHAQGRKSLIQRGSASIRELADALGWNETKVRKACQFADSTTGYTQEDLDHLCDLVVEHKPRFGISHVMELVTVPDKSAREEVQSQCIRHNWSLRDLQAAIRLRFGSRGHGGRHRQVGPYDVLIQLKGDATTFLRLGDALRRSEGDALSLFQRLPPEMRAGFLSMERAALRLKDLVVAKLETLCQPAA